MYGHYHSLLKVTDILFQLIEWILKNVKVVDN
ncbi:hypothetical protein Bhyg_02971 [Pseudolycoriella hygida]|uniref:Uncharacterized protein n=1 Tax=Pseudolycoriella hygida TaxID=35572 RepID=A0A9Q0NCG2_9DIPT|nr:hypothetical protein Bhyg_02971 [Pseudolycoriella hygida]